MNTERTYSTSEVARMVGISYRRLDHAVRRGLIAGQVQGTKGSGDPRVWTEADVERVREILRAQDEAYAILERAGLASLPPKSLMGERPVRSVSGYGPLREEWSLT